MVPMINYLHLIDTQTTGPRCDVTPLFADAEAFAWLVAALSEPFAARPSMSGSRPGRRWQRLCSSLSRPVGRSLVLRRST
ncbi:MAG: hypothetical protein H0T73_16365 [Ardenticatenales bacterium]|nr:hypothetical protein [Ardenticatenales bacterium]